MDPSLRSFSQGQQSCSEIRINVLLGTCAELYRSLVDFLSKIRDFNEFEQQAKTILPNIKYKTVTRIHRILKGLGKSENTPDALGKLFLKGRFGVKSFIPMLDALEVNLRRATTYSDTAESFSFLLI